MEAGKEVVASIKAHIASRKIEDNERFWQALCGEALANYIWQNADAPLHGMLTIEQVTSSMRRWIDTEIDERQFQ